MFALYALSGFCVGALVGMTGIGGGSLMTPLLILLFGIHPVAAVGTDLLYAGVTKSVGTLVLPPLPIALQRLSESQHVDLPGPLRTCLSAASPPPEQENMADNSRATKPDN